ncbi:MAG TPA: hypothetical protein VHG90_14140 [Acidimicrobiales bacterium]|nr:hypothetical protein [Acidimicrobiales bacterium]
MRVVHHGQGVTCELVAVERRRPVRRPVALSTATALVASGTPVVVRRCPCTDGRGVDAPAATAVR